MKNVYFIISALLAGCTSQMTDLDSLCKDVYNSYECAQIIEKYQLPHYNDLVKRTGNKLLLKTKRNQEVILEDIDKGPEGVWYCFRDYLKEINAYIVFVQYYEGGAYCLINSNSGNMVYVPGLIKISPNRQRIVSYNLDLEARYSFNGFVIYRMANDTFVKEFEIETEQWGPTDARWIGNDRIEIEKALWLDNDIQVAGTVMCSFENNKWVIGEI